MQYVIKYFNNTVCHMISVLIKNGIYICLRSDNFITKLSLFCTKLFPQERWYERDVYFTTADKGEEYVEDKDFLRNV